jgi:hypothetical protein
MIENWMIFFLGILLLFINYGLSSAGLTLLLQTAQYSRPLLINIDAGQIFRLQGLLKVRW